MLKDKIEDHLKEMEITFEYYQENKTHSFFFDLELNNDIVRFSIGINYHDDFIAINSVCPTPLPLVRTPEILEFISRINYNDWHGAFVYDFEKRLISYQCAFFIENAMSDIEPYFVRNFELALKKIDFYIPGLLSVGFGDKQPALVINQLEFETDPTLN